MTQFGRALHALNIDDAPITDHMVDAACTLNRSATAFGLLLGREAGPRRAFGDIAARLSHQPLPPAADIQH